MDSKYLPSRIFVIRIVVILLIIGVVFGVIKIVKYFKNKPNSKTPVKVLVKDIVQKDSNSNGIADWEEYLWGLNPSKNGPENKEFIMAKRKTLAENNNTLSPQNNEAKENEQLSKELFSVVMSLMQSGNLSEESISEVSKTIGSKIEVEQIPDIYTKNMLIINNKEDGDIAYFQAFKDLNEKYKDADLGGELTIIAQGIEKNDPQALYIATTIASSYRSFGKELIKIPVPEYLSEGNLNLANDYEKVSQSLEGMLKILDNPLIGMRALLSYKKYTDKIMTDLENISSNLD
ncbi:hypothetical protein A2467_01870 [Candidatus Nomurabacteria bacterium RIFOXYC2_FULL_36_8]|nr:MAG: hypothetical protein UR97_C0006G0010 [Candidatus Nomurabacteria bacterium GW2011_GWE2_36_115]KKP93531.1 MAG: hypothetical protein US00_C0006G0011 [Candidatus Nomurabacteria bacterium GW2011_GWF2_36_126]KKP97081.1 MAG: hypothetical protein US04_C0001G0584 [Candidatus Nomurabacteria bacterium GW2011_GWD2_36_14]KKP98917.1 MAG: hypothetical protein US08_C0005G0025 [Candidatus Nomurabacteria bacterium GW2011_GWF2_36_19]KKQ05958.1 MAG: hypothetical protein US17_C0001G0136 [Candidatus Nomuraba